MSEKEVLDTLDLIEETIENEENIDDLDIDWESFCESIRENLS